MHRHIYCTVVSHFSKSIPQTTTFWALGLGLLGIRVILRGNSGFYDRIKGWRNGNGLGEEKWDTTACTVARLSTRINKSCLVK